MGIKLEIAVTHCHSSRNLHNERASQRFLKPGSLSVNRADPAKSSAISDPNAEMARRHHGSCLSLVRHVSRGKGSFRTGGKVRPRAWTVVALILDGLNSTTTHTIDRRRGASVQIQVRSIHLAQGHPLYRYPGLRRFQSSVFTTVRFVSDAQCQRMPAIGSSRPVFNPGARIPERFRFDGHGHPPCQRFSREKATPSVTCDQHWIPPFPETGLLSHLQVALPWANNRASYWQRL